MTLTDYIPGSRIDQEGGEGMDIRGRGRNIEVLIISVGGTRPNFTVDILVRGADKIDSEMPKYLSKSNPSLDLGRGVSVAVRYNISHMGKWKVPMVYDGPPGYVFSVHSAEE